MGIIDIVFATQKIHEHTIEMACLKGVGDVSRYTNAIESCNVDIPRGAT